ncbi:MAG: nitroreductase family protein [Bdellovibrionaceae bacterium]|nr:nitroreductase family protein [Bdellovibrionales bacterium]MCB9085126.1 nitroreductase family protein [Pseudobdellovibrionaceae bacterium]
MTEVNKDLDLQFDPQFSNDGKDLVEADSFERLVAARRSVRRYEADPIPDDVVEKCLDLALKAPNSSNLQPWEFYWVKTPEKRDELARNCFSQPAAATAPTLIVAVARIDTYKANAKQMVEVFEKSSVPVPKPAIDYYKKLVPMAYTLGPLSIWGRLRALGMWGISLFRPIPALPANRDQLFTWAVKTTALACENLMLAFRAYGFDTCPMEGIDPRRIKKLLKLPRGAEVVMVISAGKRAAGGVYGPRIRFDREQFIKRV